MNLKHLDKAKVCRVNHVDDTTFLVGNCLVGRDLWLIGGPCAVESYDQTRDALAQAKADGANTARGGAFKPRTWPYDFQGLGVQGLDILVDVRRQTGLPIVTEVTEPEFISAFYSRDIDVLQIGSRNASNFPLLKKVARVGFPILLKRGASQTLPEFLGSAEYLLSEGANNVALCLRGIRTFQETDRRYASDIDDIPKLREITHLPVIYDPSHATGRRDLVHDEAIAAVRAGAQGLMVELHCNPEEALCDGPQSVTHMEDIVRDARAIYRTT